MKHVKNIYVRAHIYSVGIASFGQKQRKTNEHKTKIGSILKRQPFLHTDKMIHRHTDDKNTLTAHANIRAYRRE